MPDLRERPLSIAMMALGGQGGGVLTKWLVDLAEKNGYMAQSTYVAGVAQRTGATVYCVEMFPASRAAALGKTPVFTPYPVPGDVDVVVAGELAETGRAIQKGFVTPNVTTLIASAHRVYSITEKIALGDGIVDQAPVIGVAKKVAKRFVCFDMQAAADNTGSVISSVLLGAIAGTGTLPFDRGTFEQTIRDDGRAVEANLAGFAAGYEKAMRGDDTVAPLSGDDGATRLPAAEPAGPNGEALASRITAEFPEPVRDMILHGALRTLDFQDPEYANAYLDRLAEILALDDAHGGTSRGFALTIEVARQLALQMCYEDTIRVADLKTRGERFARIREHLAAKPDQPAHVVEYFHPRFEEFCDTLPAGLGRRILESGRMRRLTRPLFSKGRNISTTNISGFLMLRIVAKLKRWRRGTYRFTTQRALIDGWIDRIKLAVASDYNYALSIARCIQIVKGYGDTYERGLNRYRATVEAAANADSADRAALIRELQTAALADEQGRLFAEKLADLGAAQ